MSNQNITFGKLKNVTRFNDTVYSRGYGNTYADGYETPDIQITSNTNLIVRIGLNGINTSSNWGGSRTEVYYSTDSGATWIYLGNTGYDVAMCNDLGCASMSAHNIPVPNISVGTVRFKMRHNSHSGTVYFNNTSYGFGAQTLDEVFYNNVTIEEYEIDTGEDPNYSSTTRQLAAQAGTGVVAAYRQLNTSTGTVTYPNTVDVDLPIVSKGVGTSMYAVINLASGINNSLNTTACWQYEILYTVNGVDYVSYGITNTTGINYATSYSNSQFTILIKDIPETRFGLRINMKPRVHPSRYMRWGGSASDENFRTNAFLQELDI